MIFYLSENKIENLCKEYNLDEQSFISYLKKSFQCMEMEKGGVSLRFERNELDESKNYQYILKKLNEREIFHDFASVKHLIPYHYYSMFVSLEYADGECPKRFKEGDILKFRGKPFDRQLIDEIMITCSVENFPVLSKERRGDLCVYRQNSLGSLMSNVSSAMMVVFITEVLDKSANGTPLIIRI